ncbi:GTP pyrophosphokinase [Arthrobacter psychrochitiniphilus]|nr:RelA/SpoT domain-containing protein [Arthrobacter psychrochitiniphilus]NYG16055.1 ppGpp synthetase/RelA/SpoT-type nucleotidyltransferase [Arthrobacter psychrochitiniphilus]
MNPDAIGQREVKVDTWYDKNLAALTELLHTIEEQLISRTRTHIAEAKAVVSGRVKMKGSLIAKATESHESKTYEFKYDDFTTEIKDIVAIRVLVPMTQELFKVQALIEGNWKFARPFTPHEGNGTRTRPGYRSMHGILDVSELGGPVKLVEIQLRTILQHAWAELSHDLLYKPSGSQRDDLERRLHAVAGMLELADREFLEIRSAQLGLEGIGGPLNLDGVRKLATRLFTPEGAEDHTDESWYAILTDRIQSLGHDRMSQVRDQLGDALVREAQALHPRLNVDFAWTNPAFLLDVWIRHASGNGVTAKYDFANFTALPNDRGIADD